MYITDSKTKHNIRNDSLKVLLNCQTSVEGCYLNAPRPNPLIFFLPLKLPTRPRVFLSFFLSFLITLHLGINEEVFLSLCFSFFFGLQSRYELNRDINTGSFFTLATKS